MRIMHVCILECTDAKVDVLLPNQEKTVVEVGYSVVELVKMSMHKITNTEMK